MFFTKNSRKFLPPLPRQHSAAISCTKTDRSDCTLALRWELEGLLQRWRRELWKNTTFPEHPGRGSGCSELWKNTIFPEHPVNKKVIKQPIYVRLFRWISENYYENYFFLCGWHDVSEQATSFLNLPLPKPPSLHPFPYTIIPPPLSERRTESKCDGPRDGCTINWSEREGESSKIIHSRYGVSLLS